MIRRRSSLVGLAARTAVVTKTVSAVSHSSAQKNQQRVAQQNANQQAAAVVPQAAVVSENVAGAVSVDDKTNFMSQLQELANLHTQGLLTAEEFSAAKAKLLA